MTSGKCVDELVFPQYIELTARELELMEGAREKAYQILAAGKFTIYYPFRGTYRITQGYSSTHKAYDFGTPNGVPLYPMFPTAEITFAAKTTDGYAWNMRMVDASQGLMCLYAHMPDKNPFVAKVGQIVQWSEVVGYSDDTGNSTGPHLHCEVRMAPYYAYSSAWNYLSEIDPFPEGPPVIVPPFVLPVIPALPVVKPTAAIAKTLLNVRSLPNVLGADLGDLFPGQIAEVYGYDNDSYGNIWFAVKKDRLVGWAAAYYFGQTYLELVI